MIIRFKYTLLTVLAAASAGAIGQPSSPQQIDLSQPLSLGDAIQIALRNQNQIGIAESQKAAAEARLLQSKSAYFPTISPNYQYTAQKSSRGGTQSGRIATIDLTQTMYDSGIREQTVARSRNSLRGAVLGVTDTRQSVVLTVTNSWYELLRARELVRVAESGVERAQATLDSTRAFVQAGASAQKDVLQAQADYDNAKVSTIQAGNNVRLAQTALKLAMGITSRESIVTETPESTTPEPPMGSLDKFVTNAFESRPDLKRAIVDADSSRRTVKVAKINAGPRVTSTVGASYKGHPNPGADSTLMTSISMPLFDAGASRAAVREAKEAEVQANLQLELTRQAISSEVESAFLERDEAWTRIQASDTALKAARENYAAASESHKEGSSTILDVITAQNQLITAETSSVQAVYDYYTASARLERAAGTIHAELIEGDVK